MAARVGQREAGAGGQVERLVPAGDACESGACEGAGGVENEHALDVRGSPVVASVMVPEMLPPSCRPKSMPVTCDAGPTRMGVPVPGWQSGWQGKSSNTSSS